ncbi:MAG: hypothetical protein J0I19_13605 [Alphaproteobacteria bacterium]|nr:hypothetical protein [Alphaproteobacteria bacterium]
MSFAPAISFFAPNDEFLPPPRKPIRRALPPPPPNEAPKDSLGERIGRRLLAMDPILFMTGLLAVVSGAVVALWDAMGLVLPL